MKIAILTSGILPVPAVQGGAVENLIDFYLEYNDRHRLHDITVYSVWHPDVKRHPALRSEVNHYTYIKTDSTISKFKKAIYKKCHEKEYYHSTIEFYLEETIKRIKKECYDLVIVENRPGFILKLKKRIEAKFVLHLHNDFLNPETRESFSIFAGFDGIISVSDFITKRVRQIEANSSKCKTVYNAIDLKRFLTATAKQRSAVGLSDKDFIVFFSGRLTKEKGILELIQAIKQIKDIPHIKLIIAGASFYGKDSNVSPYIKRLQEESESIKEQVVFTSFIDYQDMPSYLKAADVVVVPSMWEEPFGLTVLEAMAAGVPLIATRCGGIPEVCEGVSILIERENVCQNIVNAIRTIYNDPERARIMAQNAARKSRDFDKTPFAEKYFNTIHQFFPNS